MPGGIEGAAAERLRRPTPMPPDQEDIAPSVQALLGAVLERRYRPDTVVEVRDEVAWLRGASIANGSPVDFLVAPIEASEARRVAFSKQAELVARLDHPGCPRFLEFGSRTDGTLFVVQSPVPIRTVRSLFAAPMNVEQALELANQLLEIVSHIHEQGVVHGNLTPESVRIGGSTGRREVHVVGFSDAELIEQTDVDPALDVYGVGLILYHLLAGRGPFADGSGDEPAPLPRSVPEGLRAVVAKMVASDPGLRFVGASEAMHALRNWTDESAAVAVPESAPASNDVVEEPRADDEAARLPDAVANLVEELGSGSREVAAAPVVELLQAPSELEEPNDSMRGAAPAGALVDPPADGPTGQVVEPAATVAPVEQRKSNTLIWAAVLVLGLGAVGFAVLRGTSSDTGADAENAAAAAAGQPKTDEPTDKPAVAAADDAAPSAPPATDAPTKVEAPTGVDPMKALALVNDPDVEGAPPYAERHQYLEQVRATASTASLVDEELNATLDLIQASQAAAPCATFDAGLALLEQKMSEASEARLCGASIEVPSPGEEEEPTACEGLSTRLAALCSNGTDEARSEARRRRRANSRRSKPAAPPPPAPEPVQPAAPAKPKPKPKPQPKKSSAGMDKLDDELRPFDGSGN